MPMLHTQPKVARSHVGAFTSGAHYSAARPLVLALAKLLFLGLSALPSLRAAPIIAFKSESGGEPSGKPPSDPRLWIYLSVAVVLVLLGGIFAGLTIALMGQDDVNLQVIHASGEGKEKVHAGSVLQLLKRGKHWVLVTLLLSNVITNETLPIVLDRSLGGGWPAVLSSTALIVIFGEIIPQSICVRYGLPIGAWMAPLVLGLMYILGPIAWPTAKLLDWTLGEDHGTIYKKAGLKTLVTLHRTLGTSAGERLNQDEVTIITAVLDLKDKAVGSIMTPIDNTFTLSVDTVLDQKMIDTISFAGYSRIPIHAVGEELNFIGMLLVKTLITYDPDDAKRVADFPLATLPETRPETSCLDIVNFFQEGKSHMVLVSEYPGENHGALGVVTLEDVIEELIGEEIVDESDVYIDVHKAIRRKTPALGYRVVNVNGISDAGGNYKVKDDTLVEVDENVEHEDADDGKDRRRESQSDPATGAKATGSIRSQSRTIRPGNDASLKRGSIADLRSQQPKLNSLASRARFKRNPSVVIKGGQPGASGGAGGTASSEDRQLRRGNSDNVTGRRPSETSVGSPNAGPGTALLSSAGKMAKDGVLALHANYGSLPSSAAGGAGRSSAGPSTSNKGVQADSSQEPDSHAYAASSSSLPPPPAYDDSRGNATSADAVAAVAAAAAAAEENRRSRQKPLNRGSQAGSARSTSSTSSVASLPGRAGGRTRHRTTGAVRSGSITENVVEAGGIRKIVLETTSSSDDAENHSDSKSNNNSSSESKQDEHKDGLGKFFANITNIASSIHNHSGNSGNTLAAEGTNADDNGGDSDGDDKDEGEGASLLPTSGDKSPDNRDGGGSSSASSGGAGGGGSSGGGGGGGGGGGSGKSRKKWRKKRRRNGGGGGGAGGGSGVGENTALMAGDR